MKYGFPKQCRLLNSKDFSYLRENSTRVTSRNMIAYYRKSQYSLEITRIGTAISKKVGKANMRNSVKRRIREYFRVSSYKNMGIDIIFVVSPNILRGIKSNDFNTLNKRLKTAIDNIFNSIDIKS